MTKLDSKFIKEMPINCHTKICGNKVNHGAVYENMTYDLAEPSPIENVVTRFPKTKKRKTVLYFFYKPSLS